MVKLVELASILGNLNPLPFWLLFILTASVPPSTAGTLTMVRNEVDYTVPRCHWCQSKVPAVLKVRSFAPQKFTDPRTRRERSQMMASTSKPKSSKHRKPGCCMIFFQRRSTSTATAWVYAKWGIDRTTTTFPHFPPLFFLCWHNTRKSLLGLPLWARSKHTGSISTRATYYWALPKGGEMAGKYKVCIFTGFWFLVCYNATQLAIQFHREPMRLKERVYFYHKMTPPHNLGHS